MSYEWCDLPEELPGELDEPVCDWCGSVCYDSGAELVNGHRLCAAPCVAEYHVERALERYEALQDRLAAEEGEGAHA